MKIIEHNGYQELQVTFKEFIKLIRPDDKSELEKYFETTNGNFIFRGQSNSSYDLIPSAFRENVSYSSIAKDYLGFCFRQYVFLKQFVHGCDLNAVSIPNDSHDFREKYFGDNTNCYDPRVWPEKQLYELIGLAQHYGYPTEFLDWSYNPLVACYFAVSGVIKNTKKIKKSDSMSIWVFDTGQIYSVNTDNKVNLELINIPRSSNINVSAQEGCFTLVRQNFFSREDLVFDENGKIKQVKLLTDLMHEKKLSGLLKITVKLAEATNIFDYCSSYRMNSATLFRGYEGAAKYAIDSMNYGRFRYINGIKGKGIPI